MGISARLMIKPSVNVMVESFRLSVVFPWLFMRFPALRFPKAV